jgi:hypothetical protein
VRKGESPEFGKANLLGVTGGKIAEPPAVPGRLREGVRIWSESGIEG